MGNSSSSSSNKNKKNNNDNDIIIFILIVNIMIATINRSKQADLNPFIRIEEAHPYPLY